ncbi:MAG TPA: helix-turn-helix domain-containing protein [Acidimicrobiia bacterium]|nr:helix-turn-helix domain-containing protein [Acidimicrobiia bacterium]
MVRPGKARSAGTERDLRFRALADPTRRDLLRFLDRVGTPQDVGTLAAEVGLHPNTVRDHLELMHRAGLVARTTENRDKPGRPKVLFEAAARGTRSPGSEGYRFLAEVLAGYMHAHLDNPAAAAEEAGRAWGRYMVEKPEPFDVPDASEVLEQIVTALAEMGFAPEEEGRDDRFVIRLHDCPFREVARSRTDIVCSVHLGMLRGMAEELGESMRVDDLAPFVEPSVCVVSLSRTERAGVPHRR